MKPTLRFHRLPHRVGKLSSLVASHRRPWSPGKKMRPGLARGLALVAIAIGIVVSAAPVAGAQETGQPESVVVTVTEEPGVCTELGAFCERLMEWTGNEQFSETIAWLIGTPLKIAVIALGAVFANRLARRGIKRVVAGLESDVTTNLVTDVAEHRSDERARTIGTLLRSASSTLIFSIAFILMLDHLGLNIVPLLASLGIAGIALGFGAQTLIEDLISGMMLVIEDQLGVGDDVDVGVVSGTVERLTLRSTVILDSSGVRWYVPNSEIRHVANESQHKSRAKVQIGVAYGANLPSTLKVLHDAAVELASEARWQEAGIEEVPIPFVAELGEHAVVVEVHVFIDAATRGSLEKALRERLVAAAATYDVVLPHERHDVWLQTEAPSVARS
jgi:small-conductance mechanosensitive channel